MKSHITSIALLLTVASTSLFAQEITDLDNDGVISTEEVQAAREAARAERLAQFDADGNGELSDEERQAAKEARRAERVAEFDTDRDGELSEEERQAARAARQADFAANFDLDQSGDLSEAEQANLDAVADARGERKGGKRNKRGNR